MKYSDADAKLIATTNPSMEKFVGETGHLMAYVPWVTKQEKQEVVKNDSAYFDMLTTFLYTSTIQKIEDDSKYLTLYTMNSIYKFERLDNGG